MAEEGKSVFADSPADENQDSFFGQSKQRERFNYLCSLLAIVSKSKRRAKLSSLRERITVTIFPDHIVCSTGDPKVSVHTVAEIQSIMLWNRPHRNARLVAILLEEALAGEISPQFLELS